MPITEDADFFGPLSRPEEYDVNPEIARPEGSLLGASLRSESSIVSVFSSYQYDPMKPFDPDYRPWEDIQGTVYEFFPDRFVGARDADDVQMMMAQIDREMDDDAIIEASGWMGKLSVMGASLFSPTSFIPGGAIVKGVKGGVSIGKTALSVSGSAALATSIDEALLQASQVTRSGTESAVTIGGSIILGGMLGTAAGKLSKSQFKANAKRIEEVFEATYDLDRAIRSVGAAETKSDLTLRNEWVFQAIRKTPIIGKPLVGSDPLLRTMLHDITEVRSAASRLVEPVLEYKVNESGQTALGGGVPVETRVKTRRHAELGGLISDFSRYYGEYDRDGPVGMVGRLTSPVSGKWGHLVGRERKMSMKEFASEVSVAARNGDKHPIPQVQEMAESIRRNLFAPVAKEMEELGMLPEGLKLADQGSYLTRVYNIAKITQHHGDGTADDLVEVLVGAFTEKRTTAQRKLQKGLGDITDLDRLEVEELAGKTDAEIRTEVRETIQAIKGIKPGQSTWQVTTAKPSRARVLDVPDQLIEPWLEPDIRNIITNYFDRMVPDIETIREFGDLDMTDVFTRIADEEDRLLKAASTKSERTRIAKEAKNARRDLLAMRDRIRGVYAQPENPRSAWVIGGRVARTLSYTSLLGKFMISAMPDIASLVGRSGLEVFSGTYTALTDPKRLGIAFKSSAELGASAEWFLNSRAMEIANLTDPFSTLSRTERMVSEIGKTFSYVSGVIPWNAGWKTVGGAFVASRMAKAADAVASGSATTKQLRILGANGIEPWMAERIAKQLSKYGDKDGPLWLTQAGKWDDLEAFQAFRHAMNREFDLMVITPGQDKPLSFSTEAGRFFFQFKSFGFSAHHRILLAGIQRADADTLATVTTMFALGVLVSNIYADLRGTERKEGVALWEDAIDRSGLAGWLMEVHAPVNALAGGALSPSGEEVSRFRARSTFEGFLGPSYGIAAGVFEAGSSASKQIAGTGRMTQRDIDRISRAVPGNNLWWLLGLTEKIEERAGDELGVKRRK
jgi:hypothetical protein